MRSREQLRYYTIAGRLAAGSDSVRRIKREVAGRAVPAGVEYNIDQVAERDYILSDWKAFIFDFEGEVEVCGVLLGDYLSQYYLPDAKDQEHFLRFLLDLFAGLQSRGFYGFHFSRFEKEMCTALLEEFPEYAARVRLEMLVDLQSDPYESVQEAVLQLGVRKTGDVVRRQRRLVDLLLESREFELVLRHNVTCLQMESLLFRRRFLKMYGI